MLVCNQILTRQTISWTMSNNPGSFGWTPLWSLNPHLADVPSINHWRPIEYPPGQFATLSRKLLRQTSEIWHVVSTSYLYRVNICKTGLLFYWSLTCDKRKVTVSTWNTPVLTGHCQGLYTTENFRLFKAKYIMKSSFYLNIFFFCIIKVIVETMSIKVN